MSYYDQLYELNMMQTKNIGEFEVTRVPSGWVFRSATIHHNKDVHGTNGKLSISMRISSTMVLVPYEPKRSYSPSPADD